MRRTVDLVRHMCMLRPEVIGECSEHASVAKQALERALVDDAYRATVHIDRAVQADLPRATPPVRASPTPLRTAPEPCQLRTTPPPGATRAPS